MNVVLQSDPSAVREWRRRRGTVRRNLLRPPPKLTIAEWADRYRVVPPESSPEPGPWRTDRVPYLRGIMDALSDRRVTKVVAMLASQTGKTEVILNTVGYYVDQEPSPILVIQPNEKPMGEAFSKDRLAPMIRDTPALRRKIKSARVKDSGNTMLHKSFVGGHVTIAGANSAAGLASRPIRVVLFDEVDRYERSAGGEGDPIALGVQRTANFTWTKKVFLVSTPGVSGLSRIEREWHRSDQRRFFLPCPDCGHRQWLRWGGPDDDFGLKWDRVPRDEIDELGEGDVVRGDFVHRTNTAAYLCESCGVLIPETKKPWMLRCGEWAVTRPDGEFPGFHLSALCSPWVPWPELVREFLEKVDDPIEFQTFVNTKLGEPWEERGEKVSASTLEARAEEHMDLDGEVVDVPDGVGVLTAGVDVQGDRLELLVCGWGVGEESWDILHERIYGDPEAASTWARLDGFLTRQYARASGSAMRILATMVDAGYKTDAVYQFVKPRESRNVWAAMGDNGAEKNPPLRRPTRSNNAGVKVFTIGVWELKDTLFKSLRIARPGPRHIHLRTANPDRCNGFDAEYFAQFEGEKLVTEIVRGSRRPRRIFKQVRKRNEAIDLRVLNHAALMALGGGVREKMAAWVDAARKPVEEREAQRKAAKAPKRRKNWATDWK